jgi:hypothetical protein
MQTECIPDIFGFEAVEGRQVMAAFDGGAITSDAGALLLGCGGHRRRQAGYRDGQPERTQCRHRPRLECRLPPWVACV